MNSPLKEKIHVISRIIHRNTCVLIDASIIYNALKLIELRKKNALYAPGWWNW